MATKSPNSTIPAAPIFILVMLIKMARGTFKGKLLAAAIPAITAILKAAAVLPPIGATEALSLMTTLKTSFNQSNKHQRDKKFLIILTLMLIIGVITTLSGYKLSKNILTREKLKIFNQDAEKIQQWIEERMLNHVNALRGLQAFWIGNNQAVTREKFNLYLDSLNLLNDFPGISSVAFIKRANEKIITTYIKPLADREAALGFDHNTDPARKAFLSKLETPDGSAASDPLALITTNRSGMFLAAPLYADSITPESIIERQRQLVGF